MSRPKYHEKTTRRLQDKTTPHCEFNKLKAAEITYFLKEKKFEAISDSNQRVKTTFGLGENKEANY